MLYKPVTLVIAKNQIEKLKAMMTTFGREQKPISIKVDLNNRGGGSGGGEQTLLLTRGQIAKLARAKAMGKSTKTIRLSTKQVHANISHDGGFLGLLAGLAAKVLPSLAKAIATGLVSGAVSKAISSKKSSSSSSSGNGLYLYKSGHCIKVEPVKGDGLYLHKHEPLDGKVRADGLYLKRGSCITSGDGLIFGKNSPVKNIPILGYLLCWL